MKVRRILGFGLGAPVPGNVCPVLVTHFLQVPSLSYGSRGVKTIPRWTWTVYSSYFWGSVIIAKRLPLLRFSSSLHL